MADDKKKQTADKKKTETKKSSPKKTETKKSTAKPKASETKKSETKKTETKKSSPKKGEKVSKGDIITFDFDAWVVDQDGTDELFETTSEELAKSEDIFDEKAKYQSLTTLVGANRVVAGLDKSLEGAEVGKKTTVEIPPSEGDGAWDPKLVEIFPMREFAKEEYQPYPGMEVTVKNKTGRIVTVQSGRVRVDFNAPLAGKTVRYEYTISKKANKADEKALGIIAMDYGNSEDFNITGKDDLLEITLPEICKYDQNWFVMKYRVVGDLREHTDFKSIKFIEEYIKKEEPKEEKKADDKKADDKKEDKPKSKPKAKPKAKKDEKKE